MMEIKSTEQFRRIVLVGSIIMSLITLFVLTGNTTECYGQNIDIALWLAFSVQISTFVLLLFHYIGLG